MIAVALFLCYSWFSRGKSAYAAKRPQVPEVKLLWFGHEGLQQSFFHHNLEFSVQKRRASEIHFQDKFRFQEATQAAFLVNSTHTHTHSNSVSSRRTCTLVRRKACTEIDGLHSNRGPRVSGLRPREMCQWVGFCVGFVLVLFTSCGFEDTPHDLMMRLRVSQNRVCVYLGQGVCFSHLLAQSSRILSFAVGMNKTTITNSFCHYTFFSFPQKQTLTLSEFVLMCQHAWAIREIVSFSEAHVCLSYIF